MVHNRSYGMDVQDGFKARDNTMVSIHVPETVLRVKGSGQWQLLG